VDANTRQSWSDRLPAICLILALAAVVIVYFSVSGDPLYRLTIIIGYSILILLFFIGLMVLIAIATGKIDLSLLLSESGGGASMSRFQLLIFTFLIAFSIFMMIVSSGTCGVSGASRTGAAARTMAFGKPGPLVGLTTSGPCTPMKFPAIPSEILMLLGISASTYAVSKGIQSSTPGMTKKGSGQTTTTVTTPPATPATTTVQTPAAGQTATVRTTAPAPGAAGTTTTVQTPNLDDNPK
jgi:hypothetical protein